MTAVTVLLLRSCFVWICTHGTGWGVAMQPRMRLLLEAMMRQQMLISAAVSRS